MFDGGLFLGRNPVNGNELDGEGLISRCGSLGTGRAVVSSYQAIFGDYREGNEEVLELSRRFPERIVPAVSVSPFGIDVAECVPYLEDLRARGARVLAICTKPRYYEIRLDSCVLRRVAEAASGLGFAIQFVIDSLEDLSRIVELYGSLTSAVMIRWAGGGGYFTAAEFIAAADAQPGLFFDVGSANGSGDIRRLVERVGARRLFLASNAPEGFALSSRLLLRTAGLEREEEEQVAWGTLAALFGDPSPSAGPDPRGRLESCWQDVMASPKIDCHWHCNSWNLMDTGGDVHRALRTMELFNIRKSIVSSSMALNYDIVRGNEEVKALIEADGTGRIYGHIVVDPLRVEASLGELKKYAGDGRFAGVKTIQDLYGLGLNEGGYREILPAVGDCGLPVMAHLPGLDAAAKDFPDQVFVAAHSTWGRVKDMMDRGNVYFEIATSHNDAAETQLERLVAEAGAGRILYGSDAELISPAWTLGKIASSRLDGKTLAGMLHANALNAFPRLRT